MIKHGAQIDEYNPIDGKFFLISKRNGGLFAKAYTLEDSQLIAAAPDLLEACKTAENLYGALHDALSEMVESGRLKESDIPDDYRAIVHHLEKCVVVSEQLKEAIQKARGE